MEVAAFCLGMSPYSVDQGSSTFFSPGTLWWIEKQQRPPIYFFNKNMYFGGGRWIWFSSPPVAVCVHSKLFSAKIAENAKKLALPSSSSSSSSPGAFCCGAMSSRPVLPGSRLLHLSPPQRIASGLS